MKHTQQRRSNCPINFALETFGDPWSLLIIRDMVYFGKKTCGEFLASEEGMATNILASRKHQEAILSLGDPLAAVAVAQSIMAHLPREERV